MSEKVEKLLRRIIQEAEGNWKVTVGIEVAEKEAVLRYIKRELFIENWFLMAVPDKITDMRPFYALVYRARMVPYLFEKDSQKYLGFLSTHDIRKVEETLRRERDKTLASLAYLTGEEKAHKDLTLLENHLAGMEHASF